MNRHFRHLVAFALLLGAVPCLAATPGMQYDQNGFNPRMLDASVPQAERMKLFAHVVKLAEQGQVPAMDLAGTMFWQGSKIAGSPVKANLKQARILLANAAVHGDVLAMAKMGEMQLQAGRLQKAMTWAQLYAHFLYPWRKSREHHGGNYAYASDMIQRIMAKGGKIDDTMTKNFQAMVTKYDDAIKQGVLKFKDQRKYGNPRIVKRPVGQADRELRLLSGVADFMVGFNPDGSIKSVWLLDSLPNANSATLLRPWLKKARANSVDNTAGIRYLQVPITHYSVKSRLLRATH